MLIPRILVKCATRERPEQFKKTLDGYINNSINKQNIFYLVSIDKDDPRLEAYISILDEFILNMGNDHFKYVLGESKGKIDAINRDIKDLEWEWDIVVTYSDDMVCIEEGWDLIIGQHFEEHFPDTDGMLWFDDSYQTNICCMNIFGRKYYDRFGYIYNPEYISLFCDNETTEVAEKLGKCYKDLSICLFLHEHYARDPKYKHKNDQLMKRNEKLYFRDKEIFEARKLINFNL